MPVSCWYEPYKNGLSMYQQMNQYYGQHHDMGRGAQNKNLAPYKKHQHDKGKWWIAASVDSPAGYSCAFGLGKQFVWVGDHDPLPPHHITGQQLAQIARAAMKIPKVDIKLNPAHTSYVSMPTWVWGGGNDLNRPRTVTARIPGTGMWARVTARPGGLHISAGTSAATLHPASGDCRGMGRPFPGGNPKQLPPCGVTYHRASADQPGRAYTLTANVGWHITWNSYEGGGALPTATFGQTVQVPVGEVQSNVNGSH